MNKEKQFNEQDNEEFDSEQVSTDQGEESFIKKYKIQLISLIGLIAVVTIIAVFWFGSGNAKEEKASLYLSRIMNVYDSQNFELALKGDKTRKVRGEIVYGLEYIVNEFGGTESGKNAAFYAGKCYMELGKNNEALKHLETATGSNSALIKQGAYSAIAVIKEQQNKPKEAADLYIKAAGFAIEKEVKARLFLYAAINYAKAKDKENAVKNYKEVIGLSEFSEYGDFAKMGLTELGIVID